MSILCALTLCSTFLLFTNPEREGFPNIVRSGENGGNQYFLLFPKLFYTFKKTHKFSHFLSHLFGCLQKMAITSNACMKSNQLLRKEMLNWHWCKETRRYVTDCSDMTLAVTVVLNLNTTKSSVNLSMNQMYHLLIPEILEY